MTPSVTTAIPPSAAPTHHGPNITDSHTTAPIDRTQVTAHTGGEIAPGGSLDFYHGIAELQLTPRALSGPVYTVT